MAPDGPKIPEAAKGVLSVTGSSEQTGGRLESGRGQLGPFCSDWSRSFSEHLSQEPQWKESSALGGLSGGTYVPGHL